VAIGGPLTTPLLQFNAPLNVYRPNAMLYIQAYSSTYSNVSLYNASSLFPDSGSNSFNHLAKFTASVGIYGGPSTLSCRQRSFPCTVSLESDVIINTGAGAAPQVVTLGGTSNIVGSPYRDRVQISGTFSLNRGYVEIRSTNFSSSGSINMQSGTIISLLGNSYSTNSFAYSVNSGGVSGCRWNGASATTSLVQINGPATTFDVGACSKYTLTSSPPLLTSSPLFHFSFSLYLLLSSLSFPSSLHPLFSSPSLLFTLSPPPPPPPSSLLLVFSSPFSYSLFSSRSPLHALFCQFINISPLTFFPDIGFASQGTGTTTFASTVSGQYSNIGLTTNPAAKIGML
jgi:hypothetical protein